jgi:hypothetical protein
MARADIVVLDQGNPRVVVEAKGRRIRDEFTAPVLAGLRTLVAQTQSEWSLLADPDRVMIFRGVDLAPFATLDTSALLSSVGLGNVTHVGEAVLLIALDRWLRQIQRHGLVLEDPALRDFARAVQETDEVASEYLVA